MTHESDASSASRLMTGAVEHDENGFMPPGRKNNFMEPKPNDREASAVDPAVSKFIQQMKAV